LWYLEKKEFRVHTDPPLAHDSIHHYEHAVQVGKAVAGLARLVAENLTSLGWRTTLDRPASDEPLTFASKPIKLPSPAPWWQQRNSAQGDLWFQITPYDPRDQSAQATLWAGLGFTAPLHGDEAWIANVRAAGFEPEEEDTGSGLIEWLGAFERLDALSRRTSLRVLRHLLWWIGFVVVSTSFASLAHRHGGSVHAQSLRQREVTVEFSRLR
jgi:hypothetical protein